MCVCVCVCVCVIILDSMVIGIDHGMRESEPVKAEHQTVSRLCVGVVQHCSALTAVVINTAPGEGSKLLS